MFAGPLLAAALVYHMHRVAPKDQKSNMPPNLLRGGWKQSGIGQEETLEELLSYTRVKNINLRS